MKKKKTENTSWLYRIDRSNANFSSKRNTKKKKKTRFLSLYTSGVFTTSTSQHGILTTFFSPSTFQDFGTENKTRRYFVDRPIRFCVFGTVWKVNSRLIPSPPEFSFIENRITCKHTLFGIFSPRHKITDTFSAQTEIEGDRGEFDCFFLKNYNIR